MSNPRLDNFRVIDECGYRYIKFKETPWPGNQVEVWGSMDKRLWTLLELA